MEDTGMWEVKLPEHLASGPRAIGTVAREPSSDGRRTRVIWDRFSVGCSFFGL